jgi:hypothetical protein
VLEHDAFRAIRETDRILDEKAGAGLGGVFAAYPPDVRTEFVGVRRSSSSQLRAHTERWQNPANDPERVIFVVKRVVEKRQVHQRG